MRTSPPFKLVFAFTLLLASALSAAIIGSDYLHPKLSTRVTITSSTRCFFIFAPADVPKADPDTLWAALKEGGHVVILRHADTQPNTADAAAVKIDDCSTQRPLSEKGRNQATRIGEAFRKHEIPITKVVCSQYCRTRDTAKLAFKDVTDEPDINHLSTDPERAKAQTAILRKLASSRPEKGNLIVVTHSVNINALLGFIPDMGEAVILAADEKEGFKVLGRLAAWKDQNVDR